MANEKQEVMLAIGTGKVVVVSAAATAHAIRGGQAIAQLVLGTESPDEVVKIAGMVLSGDAERLLPILFPLQYPQMENQAL